MTLTQSTISNDAPQSEASCTRLDSSTHFTSSSLPGPFHSGSPLAFYPISFGARFYPAISPGQLLGPLDPSDFNFLKIPSSTESDDRSIAETALVMPERHDALCRDYKCCAVKLADLHSLVEHLEGSHAVPLEPYAPRSTLSPWTTLPPVSQHVRLHYPEYKSSMAVQGEPERDRGQEQAQSTLYRSLDMDNIKLGGDAISYRAPGSRAPWTSGIPIQTPLMGSHTSTPFLTAYPASPSPPPRRPVPPIASSDTSMGLSSRADPHPYLHHPRPLRAYMQFNPDDMELHVDPPTSWASSSRVPSPSPLPVSTPLSGSYSSTPFLDTYSAVPSTPPSQPISPISTLDTMEDLPPRSNHDRNHHDYLQHPSLSAGSAAAPKDMYVGGSSENRPGSSSPSSHVASPNLGRPESSESKDSQLPSLSPRSDSAPSPLSSNAAASQSYAQPAQTAFILGLKPFKCPNPRCGKSYKQPNGLKYHKAHGSCTSGLTKDLEKFEELLASKRSKKAAIMGLTGEVILSEMDVREVQKEAAERLRPFVCGVGDCQRRYKNLNGLRYHYKHSGEHGSIGLALLASGQHESVQKSRSQRHSRAASPSLGER